MNEDSWYDLQSAGKLMDRAILQLEANAVDEAIKTLKASQDLIQDVLEDTIDED